MRKQIVAGNWKMYKTFNEGVELIEEVMKKLSKKELEKVHVIFGTPFIHLKKAAKEVASKKNISVAAQNCHWEEVGAFTGEISAAMIQSVGAEYVIIGHSERRHIFHEEHEQLLKKVNVALKNNLVPIFCCGEPLIAREDGKHFDVVEKQLRDSLFHLSEKEFSNIIIAYEPVWAIGTGVTATKEQAQEMHEFIRRLVASKFGIELAAELSILYGGSCKPQNAKELFEQPDVDGGLIGGAALNADDFVAIIRSF